MQYIKREGGIKLIEKERARDNKLPLVTIIIATYNSDKFLEQALLSIKKQSYPNIELIVLDGGSVDNTINILEKYSEIIEYWKSENDNGIYDAWNKAIRVSTGKWIVFIGSDDYLEINAIKDYIEHISSLGFEPDFVSSKLRFIKENGDLIKVIGDSWCWSKFKRYMNTLHTGTLHNRSLFQKYGQFNIRYKICGDYEFLLRARDSLVTSFMPIVTTNMRLGGVSTKQILVFKEAFFAKVKTGGRNYIVALFEYLTSLFAFYLKRLII